MRILANRLNVRNIELFVDYSILGYGKPGFSNDLTTPPPIIVTPGGVAKIEALLCALTVMTKTQDLRSGAHTGM